MTYEYRIETNPDDQMAMLSRLGAEGWELCCVLPVHHYRQGYTDTHYYLKRRADHPSGDGDESA